MGGGRQEGGVEDGLLGGDGLAEVLAGEELAAQGLLLLEDLLGREEGGAEGPGAVGSGAGAVALASVGVGAVPDGEAELGPGLLLAEGVADVGEGPGGADVDDGAVGRVHQGLEGLEELLDFYAAGVGAAVLLVDGIVDDGAGGVVACEVGLDGGGEDAGLAASA